MPLEHVRKRFPVYSIMCCNMKVHKVLRIKIIIWLSLISVFIWWGGKSVMRYNEQILSTDIAYNFGDNKKGGIQFPLISFCPTDFETQSMFIKDQGLC